MPQTKKPLAPRQVALKAMDASELGDAAALRDLLAVHGAAFARQADRESPTPLHVAAGSGQLDCLQMLLPHSYARAQDDCGETALHWAARSGHADCVDALLPVSAPNARSADGATALMLASEGHHVGCVERLAKVTALRVMNEDGRHALDLASFESDRSENRLGCIKALLAAGQPGEWRGLGVGEAVFALSRLGDHASLTEVLPLAELNAPPEAWCNTTGRRVLRAVARDDQLAYMSLLLEAGAKRAVARDDRLACMSLLLDAGANPNEPSAIDGQEGRTVLMEAASSGSVLCVKALLPLSDAGAADEAGRFALELAAFEGHSECVIALLPATPPDLIRKTAEQMIGKCLNDRGLDPALDHLLVALSESEISAAEELQGVAFEALGANRLPRAAAVSEQRELARAVKEAERAAEARTGSEAVNSARASPGPELRAAAPAARAPARSTRRI